MAPLSVLLTFILVIKFCFINIYPKGYHEKVVLVEKNNGSNEEEVVKRDKTIRILLAHQST